jgi:hypothetical protein
LQAARLVVVEESLLKEAEEALDLALGLGVAWEVGEELDIQLAQGARPTSVSTSPSRVSSR